jgi:hypothetical protein
VFPKMSPLQAILTTHDIAAVQFPARPNHVKFRFHIIGWSDPRLLMKHESNCTTRRPACGFLLPGAKWSTSIPRHGKGASCKVLGEARQRFGVRFLRGLRLDFVRAAKVHTSLAQVNRRCNWRPASGAFFSWPDACPLRRRRCRLL